MQRNPHDKMMKLDKRFFLAVSRILTHLQLCLSAALIVIWLCDLFTKGQMHFLSTNRTKIPFLVCCVLSIVNGLFHLRCLDRLRSLREYYRLSRKLRRK